MHLELKATVMALATTALCGLAASTTAEPLHIEPGLWEVTYSYSLQGEPPPAVLAKLTPEQRAEMDKFYGEKGEIGWGSQIRSYVLQPYRLVKDLRTGVESGKVDDVLDGEIEGFIEPYLLGVRRTDRVVDD